MKDSATRPQLEIVRSTVAAAVTPIEKDEPPRRRWKTWHWLTIAAVSVAAVAGLWVYGVPAILGPVVVPSSVIRADLVQSVVASGHIETPFRVTVASQIAGVVTDIPVSVGQRVKVGDALVKLDDSAARASMEQAKGLLAQATAHLDQQRQLTLPAAIQSLEAVKSTLENVQEIYSRTAKLASSGIVSAAALQQAKANLGIARAQVTSAQLQVTSNQVGGNDFLLVKTQQTQAQAALDIAQSHLDSSIITAARDGIIISQAAQVGNVVQAGAELLQLSPDGQIQIVTQIDEKNLGLMTVGQEALASADAYSARTFAAKVASIDPAIDLLRAAVTVKLDVDKPPTYLRQDMTVSVDIEVNRKSKTLIVNLADLHEIKSDAAWVLKISNGVAVRSAVKVGLVSSGKAEILEGLAENDQLVPTSAIAVADGNRVRVKAPVVTTP